MTKPQGVSITMGVKRRLKFKRLDLSLYLTTYGRYQFNIPQALSLFIKIIKGLQKITCRSKSRKSGHRIPKFIGIPDPPEMGTVVWIFLILQHLISICNVGTY